MTDEAKPPAKSDPKTLQIEGTAEETMAQAAAKSFASPWLASTMASWGFAGGTMGEVDVTTLAKAIRTQSEAARDGDLSQVEMMLASQAAALNMIFGEMARRAVENRAEYPMAFDRYMKVALKAQAQCRTTVEALAAIKNPPVVYARQANIAAGPQQVNNGLANDAPAPARGRKKRKAPNELMEGPASEA